MLVATGTVVTFFYFNLPSIKYTYKNQLVGLFRIYYWQYWFLSTFVLSVIMSTFVISLTLSSLLMFKLSLRKSQLFLLKVIFQKLSLSSFSTECRWFKKRINPFFVIGLFLYPLQTSRRSEVLWCFQGVEKETSGMKWLKGPIGSCKFSIFHEVYNLANIYLFKVNKETKTTSLTSLLLTLNIFHTFF